MMGKSNNDMGSSYCPNGYVLYRLQAVEYLREAGIPCRAVLDSAVGYIMDKVDMVFVGAEGVVENGGVINKVSNGKRRETMCGK